MAFVYMHKNKLNSKVYIGITNKKKVTQRWGKNGSAYLKDKYATRFKQALLKYGWDNFDHIILHENVSLDMAMKLEKDYINKYDAYNPKHGYNMTLGGEGSIGHIVSDKTKKILSEHTKKQFEGKHLYHNKYGRNAARVVPVIKISMDGSIIEYCESMIEQARLYGMRTTNIAACCNHRQKSAKGYHWMYVEDYNMLVASGKFKDEIINLNRLDMSHKAKSQHTEGFTAISKSDEHKKLYFKDSSEIKSFLNIDDITHIYESISGKRKSSYGYYWKLGKE